MGKLPWRVLQYLSLHGGAFTGKEIDKALGLITQQEKNHRRVILKRLAKKAVILQESITINGEKVVIPGHYHVNEENPIKFALPKEHSSPEEVPIVRKRHLVFCPYCGKRVNRLSWVRQVDNKTVFYCPHCQNTFAHKNS